MGRDTWDTPGQTSRRDSREYLQNGKMVRNSKGERQVLVEHYRKLGTPTANKTFDAQFGKEINAWAEANVDESE